MNVTGDRGDRAVSATDSGNRVTSSENRLVCHRGQTECDTSVTGEIRTSADALSLKYLRT